MQVLHCFLRAGMQYWWGTRSKDPLPKQMGFVERMSRHIAYIRSHKRAGHRLFAFDSASRDRTSGLAAKSSHSIAVETSNMNGDGIALLRIIKSTPLESFRRCAGKQLDGFSRPHCGEPRQAHLMSHRPHKMMLLSIPNGGIMKIELQVKLFHRYPNFFGKPRDFHNTNVVTESTGPLGNWGIHCGNGCYEADALYLAASLPTIYWT
jgi:hypothetical protein